MILAFLVFLFSLMTREWQTQFERKKKIKHIFSLNFLHVIYSVSSSADSVVVLLCVIFFFFKDIIYA